METPEYVTVSVNEEFIDHDSFQERILKEGDDVEFLYFMGVKGTTEDEMAG